MLSDQTNIKGDFAMEQHNYTPENQKCQHLKYEDRLKLEALLKAKVSLNCLEDAVKEPSVEK